LLVRYGSRQVGMGCAVIMATVNPLMVVLRMLGLMPAAGSSALFLILAVAAFIGYAGVIMSMTVVGKMIADITDEHELATGKRQEGLLFSASIFMQKAASGIGTLVSGILIKAAQFPENAAAAKVEPQIVLNLGIGAALGGVVFGGLIYYFYSRFKLNQARHAEIVAELARRRSAQVSVATAQTPPSFSAYASASE
jgi:glycoside/pentoside/hexuronide:cation symporter, GPH family